MTSWATIRHKIGKGLNDPSLINYGDKVKTAFSAQYRNFVLNAKPEELEIERSEQVISISSGVGSYTIPLSVVYLGITEKDAIRLMPVTSDQFMKARNNTYLAPQTDEVMYYKDNNTLRFLANDSRTSFAIYVQFVADFDFNNGTSMSEVALGTIIEETINLLAGRYERSKAD
jgi:hypothetical protein